MAMFRRPDSPEGTQAPGEKKLQPPKPAATAEFLRERDLRTSLDADAVVTGKLAFNNPTRIDGTLKGELHSTSLVLVGESAVIEGTVSADDLRVAGTVRADVTRSRRIEILPSGKLIGNVTTEKLVLHEGGLFEGGCRMGAARDQKPAHAGAG